MAVPGSSVGPFAVAHPKDHRSTSRRRGNPILWLRVALAATFSGLALAGALSGLSWPGLVAAQAPSTNARIVETGAGSCSGTPVCTTGPIPVGTGDALIVLVDTGPGSAFSVAVSDTDGNTFHQVAGASFGCPDASCELSVWYAVVSASDLQTISVSSGAGTFSEAFATVLPPTFGIAGATINGGSGTSATAGRTISPLGSDDFLAAISNMNLPDSTLTPAGGQASLGNETDSLTQSTSAWFTNATSIAPISMAGTWSVSGSWVEAVIDVPGPAALTASLTANPPTVVVGRTSTLDYSVAGGTSPYRWTLERNGSASNISTASGGSYPFTPTVAGTYDFYLNVTDATGGVSQAAATVVATPTFDATLTPSATTTGVGSAVTLTIGLSHGVAPYSWTLQLNGSGGSSLDSGSSSSASYTFTPPAAGRYTFYLNATDGNGTVSTTTTAVTALAAAGETVTFVESGLPGGTFWSADLGGVSQGASTMSIVFTEPDGVYAYSVAQAGTYAPGPGIGVVTVNGSSAVVRICFLPASHFGPGVNARHEDWSRYNLSNLQLEGDDLSFADLAGANLSGSSLVGANLRHADLAGAIVRGADFQGADAAHAVFDDAVLTGLSASRPTDFNGSDLHHASFREATCGNPNYITAAGANLRHVEDVPANCDPPLHGSPHHADDRGSAAEGPLLQARRAERGTSGN